ncbi:MAG TPA: hypothetical protein VGM90_07245 [Kofleriaceae bacterium]|jgi:hypothetical protein
MRASLASSLLVCLSFAACSKNENAGMEEAKKQAEIEQKAKEADGGVAKKIAPPVRSTNYIPCDKLIDNAKFTDALSEPQPFRVEDALKGEPEASSACSLRRSGTALSPTEQKAKLKKEGRLGILPGDEVCNVAVFCSTIEDPEKFKTKCAEKKQVDDDTMGSYACKQVVAVGADDVFVFRFFDEDTKCIVQVKGGPSQVDNDVIRKCAQTARDTFTPDTLKLAVDRKERANMGSGSDGSAAN